MGKVFGITSGKVGTLNMCGGCAEWWNYILKFDEDGNFDLYHEDKDGIHHLHHNPLMYYDLEDEEVYLGDEIPEELGENMLLIDDDFFGF